MRGLCVTKSCYFLVNQIESVCWNLFREQIFVNTNSNAPNLLDMQPMFLIPKLKPHVHMTPPAPIHIHNSAPRGCCSVWISNLAALIPLLDPCFTRARCCLINLETLNLMQPPITSPARLEFHSHALDEHRLGLGALKTNGRVPKSSMPTWWCSTYFAYLKFSEHFIKLPIAHVVLFAPGWRWFLRYLIRV